MTKPQLEQLVRELREELKTKDAQIADYIMQVARLQSQLTNNIAESPQYKAMVAALEANKLRQDRISGSTRVKELEERLEKEREARRRVETELQHYRDMEALREAPAPEPETPLRPKMGRPVKITDAQRDEVRRLHAEGVPGRAIAAQVGVSTGTVSAILNGKR